MVNLVVIRHLRKKMLSNKTVDRIGLTTKNYSDVFLVNLTQPKNSFLAIFDSSVR